MDEVLDRLLLAPLAVERDADGPADDFADGAAPGASAEPRPGVERGAPHPPPSVPSDDAWPT
jgi:hypothetical protein